MTAVDLHASVVLNELFVSLQGESVRAGLPTTFIRLTGCPLRCHYCDTTYAYQTGESVSIEQILNQTVQIGARWVTLTGGEPLAQPNAFLLLSALCDEGFVVSVETGGSQSIKKVDNRVMIVLDMKTPGSGEEQQNLATNIAFLKPTDQIKFVLTSRADYDWACAQLQQEALFDRCEVLFSAAAGMLEPTHLAEWIIADRLKVRFQLQLHKWLWPAEERGR